NQLPHKVDLQVAYAIDPMLATGGSAIDAINILKLRGIPRISYVCIIAAPYGLLKLSQTHPDIDIYVAALDESLNDRGYILPGLGTVVANAIVSLIQTDAITNTRIATAFFALIGAILGAYFGWKIGKRLYREFEPPVIKDRTRKPKTRPKEAKL